MPTTVPEVDAGAMTGKIMRDAIDAVAETVVLTIDSCEENGRELNQLQKMELARTALFAVTKLETSIARTIADNLARAGVKTWGFDSDLESLLTPKGGD